MELPVYRSPQWRTVGRVMFEKVKVFLFDAGKIIVAISIILWFLSSHAPGDRMKQIENKYTSTELTSTYSPAELNVKLAAEKLESSYAGMLGKALEPAIAPLGFDWKIGIALVTSFAAREVFVGTMATIYSADSKDNSRTVRDKMMTELNSQTNLPTFSFAVSFSLLIFYAFAMQCMSTLAVVYRETKSWKWPLIQFLFMGTLAYVSAFVVFHILK